MRSTVAMLLVLGTFALSLLNACGKNNSPPSHTANPGNTVNLYMWADEIAPDTLPSFEKLTGIRVNVSYFDSPEMLESHMLTGSSGFDVVMPSDAFIQRQLRSGAYAPLDKAKLPNLAHLDPALMARVASSDPGNAHAVIYDWGTMGIGYNKAKVSKLLPGVALDSWNLIFDPALAAKLQECGINFIDDPVAVVRLALISMGRSPNEIRPADLADAEKVMGKIRPFIRNIDTSSQIQALANGDLCVVVGYNGNIVQARKRAKDAKNDIVIDYLIPKEGSLLWFDLLTIPKDAPHSNNAYRLINYLMDPAVIANISNNTGFANANKDATPLLYPAVVADPAVYPTADHQERLFIQTELTPEQTRAITRLWQKFRTGQ
ncbi:MAG: polyamine ABC transporter substrate-binding protein [Gammaproteobacteria bacterium]